MAKCHPPQNDVGSFSFRKLIASFSCGGSSFKFKPSSKTQFKTHEPEPEPELKPGSGRLVDILNLSSSSWKRDNNMDENVKQQHVITTMSSGSRLDENNVMSSGSRLDEDVMIQKCNAVTPMLSGSCLGKDVINKQHNGVTLMSSGSCLGEEEMMQRQNFALMSSGSHLIEDVNVMTQQQNDVTSMSSGSHLGEVLKEDDVMEVRKKEEKLEELRMAVRLLQCVEERENGAKMVRGFAKEDGNVRGTLGILGAIPPLVAMIDHHDHGDGDECVIQALYALLNLGIGNDMNKEAIVQVGAVHKMLKKIEFSNGSLNPALSEAIVANFLALSALDSNKPIIGASGAIPFLVSILEDLEKNPSSQARQDSLRALYNLSISPSNVALILETNLIQYLFTILGDTNMSERIISILSNVVSISEGRRAISRVPDSISILIDVLYWTDLPECQEKASYVLMVMAHKSYNDRQTMIELGIGSTLLELTLLGSTLAQKRASRILECLRVDKGKQLSRSFVNGKTNSGISAPICGSSSCTMNVNKVEECMMMSEEKKAVKELVQQSLQNNMKKIVKRANLPQDFVPSEHLKSLSASSTSKSLPF